MAKQILKPLPRLKRPTTSSTTKWSRRVGPSRAPVLYAVHSHLAVRPRRRGRRSTFGTTCSSVGTHAWIYRLAVAVRGSSATLKRRKPGGGGGGGEGFGEGFGEGGGEGGGGDGSV